MQPGTTTYRDAVSAEVRALMGRTRTTQGVLAKVLGMSQAAVSRRINGELAFDLDDVFGMARYFDVELSALLPEPASLREVITPFDLRKRSSACITADESRTTANLASLDRAA